MSRCDALDPVSFARIGCGGQCCEAWIVQQSHETNCHSCPWQTRLPGPQPEQERAVVLPTKLDTGVSLCSLPSVARTELESYG